MQTEMTGSDDAQAGAAFKRSMGLLAAVAIAVGVGLAIVDVPEADLSPRVLRTDANANRPAGVPTPAGAPAAASPQELDPTLSRPDRGSDQHG